MGKDAGLQREQMGVGRGGERRWMIVLMEGYWWWSGSGSGRGSGIGEVVVMTEVGGGRVVVRWVVRVLVYN